MYIEFEIMVGGYNDWEIGDRCAADSWKMFINEWQIMTVCTDGAANVVPILIWIVQWLDNRSECCRTDDGTRFDNAVEQICCQKISFACAYTCVHVRAWVYICICARVCAAGRMHVRGFARIWAWAHMREYCRNPEISSEYLNIGGIFKYRSDI